MIQFNISIFVENAIEAQAVKALTQHIIPELNAWDFIEQAHASSNKPTVILARTIPGKGISEIEGKYEWHGRAPTKEEAKRFVELLTK
jgi:transketolase